MDLAIIKMNIKVVFFSQTAEKHSLLSATALASSDVHNNDLVKYIHWTHCQKNKTKQNKRYLLVDYVE